jgi:chromosome segregation ATPase
LQQSAQEAIEAQGQVALTALENSTKQYADVTARALGYLENCFTDFRKQASELNTNIQRIGAALTTFSKRVDDVEAPKDLLSTKLAPIFQRIAEAAEQIDGRASSERQRNQGVARLTGRLEALTTSIEGIFDKVADKEERVATAIQQAVVVAGQTAELTRHVGQWTERFTEIEAKQSEIVSVLVQASDAARDRDRVRDESLRQSLDDAMRTMGEYEARARSMLQTHSELFETELQRAERAFTALSTTLSEGASLLASELGGRGSRIG